MILALFAVEYRPVKSRPGRFGERDKHARIGRYYRLDLNVRSGGSSSEYTAPACLCLPQRWAHRPVYGQHR